MSLIKRKFRKKNRGGENQKMSKYNAGKYQRETIVSFNTRNAIKCK